MLFGLFIGQFVLGGVLPEDLREFERIGVGIVYLVLAAVILVQQRAAPEAAGPRRAGRAGRRAVPRRPGARRGTDRDRERSPATSRRRRRRSDVERACIRGALARPRVVSSCWSSVVEAILDRNIDDFDDSGWIYPLFVVILFGYALGGFGAGRLVPEAALSNGTARRGRRVRALDPRPHRHLAACATRTSGLFTGHSPVLRPGQIFGHLVIAAALGMFGGFLGARSINRAARGRPPKGRGASPHAVNFATL